MKRKILLPMFASVMALSMGNVIKAENIQNEKQDTEVAKIKLDEYKEESCKIAKVKEGVGVKLREEGKVQTIAYSGDSFKVVATQGEWVELQLGNKEAWVPARFVDVEQSSGYITQERVNFREEPSMDSKVISGLSLGNEVKVVEVDGKWIKVKNGEKEGYVSSLYLSEDAPIIEVEEEVKESESNDNSSNNNSNTPNGNSSSSNNSSNSSNSNSGSSNGNSNTSNENSGSSNNNSNSSNSNSSSSDNNSNSSNNNSESNDSKPSTPAPPASNSNKAQAVVNMAYSKQGCPYVWGSEGPNSFDCSGFTYYVYKNAAGITLPRSSSAQSGYGQTVSKSNLQPGDLVFFNTSGSGVSHVGIYLGGGNMMHSPSPGKSVCVVSINSSYYSSKFVTGKRVL